MLSIWIKARFAAAGIVASLDALGYTIDGSLLSSRVYEDVAPPTAAYPYILFQVQTEPEVIRGVGSGEWLTDTIYTVKAVAQGSDDSVVGAVSAIIHTAMVEDDHETITGSIGTMFMSRRLRMVRFTETAQGDQFRHLGGMYQIQARAA